MNSALKLGLAATAVVVVALVGITLLPRNGGVGASGPSPTCGADRESDRNTDTVTDLRRRRQPRGGADGIPGRPARRGHVHGGALHTPDSSVCLQPPQAGMHRTGSG